MSRPLWLPWAIRKPIAAGANDPRIVPVGDVFHIAVSTSDSLHDYFDGPSGGIESTGYIRESGIVEQYRPFNVECDAQSAGNSFTHAGVLAGLNSWETEGMGDGVWTPEQLAAIKQIVAFKHEHWGHPLVQCPAWNAPGFGYHRLFDQWNPNAHSCPGDRRVQQWNQIIVPWMRDGATTLEEDDDMAEITVGVPTNSILHARNPRKDEVDLAEATVNIWWETARARELAGIAARERLDAADVKAALKDAIAELGQTGVEVDEGKLAAALLKQLAQ